MPIRSPNYTQIPNEFLDEWLTKLSGSAIKVFLAIARQELGWHRCEVKISESRLMDLSGVKSKDTLHEAVKELLENDLIKKTVTGENFKAETYYCINIADNGTENVPDNGTESVPSNGTETVHIERKDINKKETSKPRKVFCANPGYVPLPKIVFDWSCHQFDNISDEQVEVWQKEHEGVNIEKEIFNAARWLRDHPERRKEQYRAFLGNWFKNAEKYVGVVK